MSPVDYHAWTHRPKRLGGTDPIEQDEIKWARRKLTSAQTINSGSQTTIDFTLAEDINDYPDTFDLPTSGVRRIVVKEDGLYSVLCRVVCGSLSSPFIIDLNFADSGAVETELYSYTASIDQIAVDFRLEGFAHMLIRMPAFSYVYALVVHTAGSSKTITDGSFLEVRRLTGEVTTTGRDWP